MYHKIISVAFKKNHPDAKIPFKKYTGDAGYDIFAVEEVIIDPFGTGEVDCGFSLGLPKNIYCEIHTRSSMGMKGMRAHLGIVDSGFLGNISIFITNCSNHVVLVSKGDRAAQLIFRKRETVRFIQTDKLKSTSRGKNGHGSTGK